jgi:predicted metal-dependent phosphoesterase TrpH
MHTIYSDGLDTPTDLVAKASELGVCRLAITDHDTVDGLPEGIAAGQRYGVHVMSGIELTVQFEGYRDIHILGYDFDPEDTAFTACIKYMQDARLERGLEILRRVNRMLSDAGKAPIDERRVLARAQGAVARPHLAQELVEQGCVETFQEAFQEYLIPCDVPKATLSPPDAFRIVAAAGGICSLAHPGTLSSDPVEIERLLTLFGEMGLVGVEAYHHCHQPSFIDFLCQCARRHNLITTGGSDYHGRPQGAMLGFLDLNKPVPESVWAELTAACAK